MRKTTFKKSKFHKGEKLILFLLAILAISSPFSIVYSYASLASTNYEVEKLKSKIEEQENINSGLTMQVDELASLSNIQEVAQTYGLSYNNDNIIVIK